MSPPHPAASVSSAPPAPSLTSRVSKIAWWALVSLLPAVTILLFVPWSSTGPDPSVDIRPELVWSSVATVVLGALALAFPNRWMSYAAALPTIGALTDLGPVFLPETGSYPWSVKVIVVLVSLVGIAWITMAMGYPAREQQTRWIVAPVAGALTLATMWLPWVVVSGIGQESGRATAYDVLFSSYAAAAPGVVPTRLAILIIMLVGVIGAVLPLLSRTSTATRLGMFMTLFSTVAIVLLCLWMSARGDGIQLSDYATGPRVAIAGFAIIALVWSSRLKAAGGIDESPPRRIDDSGYIPVIMTGRRFIDDTHAPKFVVSERVQAPWSRTACAPPGR